MSLRIAYMTAIYPRATDTFIQREVWALRRHGVHVETFSIRKPAAKENVGPEQEAEGKGTFYIQKASPLTYLRAHLSLITKRPLRYLSALWSTWKFAPGGIRALMWQIFYFVEAAVVAHRLRKHGLTHLHNHFSNASCSVAMLAAEMGDFTFSVTAHGPNEFFEPYYWRIDEKFRRALFVSCISHFARSQAMIFAPREKWHRLHVVHCGVTPADFTPRHHQGEGSQLLFVGRLANVKGLPILFEALVELKQRRPDFRLTIAGDGPDRGELEALSRELGLEPNVTFLGYQSQRQVRELFGRADVFVLASFAEGVPVVLMEAMAAGVPVVTTEIAGIPELVEDGVSGFLVPPGNPGPLTEKVERLLADPDLRNTMGARGRVKVQQEFDIDNEAERLSMVLTGALEGHPVGVRPDLPPDEPAPEEPSADQRARSAGLHGALQVH